MKLRGGDWSKGDVLALLGLLVGVVGVGVAILAIPGMPKFFHYDSEPEVKKENPLVIPGPTMKPAAKTADVTSGQVNFGCDQTLPVETPVVSFGTNPRDIAAKPYWANTDNVKTQNQSVSNVEDADHHVVGVKGSWEYHGPRFAVHTRG